MTSSGAQAVVRRLSGDVHGSVRPQTYLGGSSPRGPGSGRTISGIGVRSLGIGVSADVKLLFFPLGHTAEGEPCCFCSMPKPAGLIPVGFAWAAMQPQGPFHIVQRGKTTHFLNGNRIPITGFRFPCGFIHHKRGGGARLAMPKWLIPHPLPRFSRGFPGSPLATGRNFLRTCLLKGKLGDFSQVCGSDLFLSWHIG